LKTGHTHRPSLVLLGLSLVGLAGCSDPVTPTSDPKPPASASARPYIAAAAKQATVISKTVPPATKPLSVQVTVPVTVTPVVRVVPTADSPPEPEAVHETDTFPVDSDGTPQDGGLGTAPPVIDTDPTLFDSDWFDVIEQTLEDIGTLVGMCFGF